MRCGVFGLRHDDDDDDDPYRPALTSQIGRLVSIIPSANTDSLRGFFRNNTVTMAQYQRNFFQVLEQRDKVVYVMGTGAGKSVAFALPVYLQPESINVMVQPTKALQTTTYERLASLGVSVRVWDSSAPESPASVVLVTPEAMDSAPWAEGN
ncbi:hypothetical protein DL764_008708 [Monosporascus ibericus]|uniref:DEAD/DEAH-box helicase domain-containing protein n=1 Tax=Monosporascus ibericus TaxID=155417 RepID=A0A4Q4SZL5_9PEZI|nr:hypothetical protein DL764_008708 [Monosporascus ibericus]